MDSLDPQATHLMQLTPRPAVRMVRGAGSQLWDEHGKRYLDFIQGWAVNCLGHSPGVIRRALDQQVQSVLNVGPQHHNAIAIELARLLAELSGLDQVFFASSGAEANEGAVKLARKWGQKHKTGAYEVITTTDSFHGRTLAMTCATGKAGFDRAFPPCVEGFPKVPYGDVEALRRAIGPRTVAIMVEPMQGEAGVVVPPDGYLSQLRTLCDEHGILLILDEIQTGVARTGPMFAHQADEITPDIMTLGKGLGGGVPLAAVLARKDVSCFDAGDHGGTYSGNALMCAVGLAVLTTLTSAEHDARRQASCVQLQAALARVAGANGAHLRGRGHLWALVLPQPCAVELRDRAFEAGLLINAARPNILRFMPALDVSEEHIDEMTGRLSRLLSELC